MKTLQELLALKQRNAERLMALMAILEGSTSVAARALTDDENAEITTIRNGATALDEQIRNAEFLKAQAAENAARQFESRAPLGLDPGTGNRLTPEDKVEKRFSLSRAVKQLVNKSALNGAEAEADAIGRAEAAACGHTTEGGLYLRSASPYVVRGSDAATALKAANLIGTTQMPTMDGYKAHLPFEGMGATVMRNLEGVQNLNVSDLLATAAYVAEAGTVPEIDPNIRKGVLTPRQVCAYISATMLLQASVGPEIEAIMWKNLEQAEGVAVSQAIINGTTPQGILGNTDVPNLDLAASGAITFAKMLELKNSPGKNNARFIEGPRGWVTNENVRGQLEALQHGTSGRFVWDYEKPDMLMGYKADTTTLVPSNTGVGTDESAIIFGIWANLFVANWSFKRLVIDEVTVKGKTLLNWYSFWDHVVASPKAFAKCRNIIAP